jgi:hypothetical protein
MLINNLLCRRSLPTYLLRTQRGWFNWVWRHDVSEVTTCKSRKAKKSFRWVCDAGVTEPRHKWMNTVCIHCTLCLKWASCLCIYISSHKQYNRFQWNLMCYIEAPTLSVVKNIAHSPFPRHGHNFTYSSNLSSFMPVPQSVTNLPAKGSLQCKKEP